MAQTSEPDYEALGSDIGRLVDSKQQAYGDSFGKSGKVMRVLYPNGISPAQMDDALTLVRILDKMFRIAQNGTRDPMGESPYRDIAGYALLACARKEADPRQPAPIDRHEADRDKLLQEYAFNKHDPF